VWNLGWAGLWGLFGTLLGPEASGGPARSSLVVLWWSVVSLWLPSFARPHAVVWGWGLVGLLFEICIVDASIFVAIVFVECCVDKL
jgi:hypothetical protein